MNTKPRVHLKEVQSQRAQTPIERARQRHGKPFAHEPGSTWTPKETPVLTAWMQTRGQK